MKRLLNTLYVLNEDSYLSLRNENVIVHSGDSSERAVPLLNLESIILFSYKGASPELLGACRKRNIGVSFLTPHGQFLCMPSGRSHGNVLLRKEQYRISDDHSRSLLIARLMIAGKIYNAQGQIERIARQYPLRVDSEKLKISSAALKTCIDSCKTIDNKDSLRGIEGKAADIYFGVMNEMILNQKSDFSFSVRSRRPPLDNINAMLSFGYSLLVHDCASALEAVGLDSYVGVIHTDRPGRESLALDLMEELRVLFVDRMVIAMINRKEVTAADFRKEESGAIYLNDEAKKKFILRWQENKKTELTHPFLNEKVSWGLIPHIQALLLARYIRGDYDAYPVFLWK